MQIDDYLADQAFLQLGLALCDTGYTVIHATLGLGSFYLVQKESTYFAVVLSRKASLKDARAGGNDSQELQKFLTIPVLQVNAFYHPDETNLVLVAPSVLQLMKAPSRTERTVETLSEAVNVSTPERNATLTPG